MSRNLSCRGCAYSADRSTRRSGDDAARWLDHSGYSHNYFGRDVVWTGGKASRRRPATSEHQCAPWILGRISIGVHFRNSRLDAEPWPGVWRKYSARRSAEWRESCHDVECGVVALPLRGIFTGRNLLLHPDAQERQCEPASSVGHLVLLADRGQYGSALVWQHHSLQYLDRETWGSGHLDWL